MAHKTVVRNKAYHPASFNTVERHNERKNEEYFNGDVQLEREHLNVHFCRHFKEDGEAETYQETFDRLLAEKKIVKHGTKPDAKLFCEFVYDINTTYSDERGGYEYAKSFFEEAYREAVKEGREGIPQRCYERQNRPAAYQGLAQGTAEPYSRQICRL